jgi:purine operon repressor
MMELLAEFDAQLVGVGIFAESGDADERIIDQFVSLIRLDSVDDRARQAVLKIGNFANEEA